MRSRSKKVQHGEQAIDVWYWAPDRKAQALAVEIGYKLKGKLKTTIDLDPDLPGLFIPAAELNIKVVGGREQPDEPTKGGDDA